MAPKTASAFQPSFVAAWSASKPWDAPRELLEAQMVPGFRVGPARGTEAASFERGFIVLKPEWFTYPSESRKAVCLHEAGHGLETAAGSGAIAKAFGVANPLDVLDLPGASRFGPNYGEIVATAYQVAWMEPDWASFEGGKEILAATIRLAREHGYPIPLHAASATLHQGVGSRWFHGTQADLDVGDVLVPANERGEGNYTGLYSDPGEEWRGEWVWLTDDPEDARVWSLYGPGATYKPESGHIYEVEPIGEVVNGTRAPKARIVRKVSAKADYDIVTIDGVDYSVLRRKKPKITALVNGKAVGTLEMRPRSWGGEGYEIEWVFVNEANRGKGIARTMLQVARDAFGTVLHSSDLTDDGRAWSEKVGAKGITMEYRPSWGDRAGTSQSLDFVFAYKDGKEVGSLSWYNRAAEAMAPEWLGRICLVTVKEEHRRQGIATEMLAYARGLVDYPIVHSDNLSDLGRPWSEKVGANGGNVPASTPVKRSRVGNIDTDRLVRRREFLRSLIKGEGTNLENRIDFVWRAAELHVIENELEGRGELPDVRMTLRAEAWKPGDTVGWINEVIVKDYPPRGGGACMIVADVVEKEMGYRQEEGIYWTGRTLADAVKAETVYGHWWNWKPNGDIFDGTGGQFHPSGDTVRVVRRGTPEYEHYVTYEDLYGSQDTETIEAIEDIIQYAYPKFSARTGSLKPGHYWRVHPAGRDWGDATSTPFTTRWLSEDEAKPKRAFDDDLYLEAMGDHNGYYLEVESLVVGKPFQRMGVGTALMDAFIAMATKTRGPKGWSPGSFTRDGAAFWKAYRGEDKVPTQTIHPSDIARFSIQREGAVALPPLHDTLYPVVFDGLTARPEVKARLYEVVNSVMPEGTKGQVRLWLEGSGASFNWDEAGDLDVQVWVALATPVGTTAAVRDALIAYHGKPLSDIGIDGAMQLQFYVHAGDGEADDAMAAKPYALYDLDSDTWGVMPIPQTPAMYAERFARAQGPASIYADQADDALGRLDRAEQSIEFAKATGLDYEGYADEAAIARQQVMDLYARIKDGRAQAYGPGGEGLNDVRDTIVKVLEAWGVWQRLKALAEAEPVLVG